MSFLLLVYSAYFIFMSSHVVEGRRYFVLFDDAMISMTYAKTLSEGCGLVWYCGAPKVEGITNLGWTLYMALWHMLPIPPERLPLVIQITGAFTLLGVFLMVYGISKELWGRRELAVLSAVTALLYFPLVYWSLLGMEVGILSFLLLILVYTRLRGKYVNISYPAVAAGILIRQDFLIPVIGVVLVDLLMRRYRKGFLTLGVALAVLGAITVFRLFYYGDLLPNTYYLKVYGVPLWIRLGRGIFSFLLFILYHPVHAFLLFLSPIALKLERRGELLYILSPLLLYVLYNVYVGADAWEKHLGNRFIATVIPLVAVLSIPLLYRFVGRWSWAIVPVLPAAIPLYEVAALVVYKGKPPYYVESGGLPFHVFRRHIYFINPRSEYHISEHKRKVCQAVYIDRFTPKDIKVGVVWAGITPYFAYGRTYIDMLGKSDRHIARLKVNLRKPWHFRPGHNKYDYVYSLENLKPDLLTRLILVLTEREKSEMVKIVNALYDRCEVSCESGERFEVFVRKDRDFEIERFCSR